jgi:ribosomal protein S27E
MAAACLSPLPLYRPRDPQASDLWRLVDQHFATFSRVYDERFQAKYGYWRPVVERSVRAYLRCGDLHEGFARIRCPDCGHEMFVAFSCKQPTIAARRCPRARPATRSGRCRPPSTWPKTSAPRCRTGRWC